MAKYTDEFRATAIAMLVGAGFEKNKTKAVDEVAQYYRGKVAKRTLFRWGNGENSPAPAKLVTVKKEDLADVFERVAYTYLKHAESEDVVDEVSGNAAVTTAATAVDKMRLLRGLPTEILGLLPDVLEALRVLGQEPSDVFNRIIQRAAQHAEQSRP
jgi:hypothetical protein